MHSSHCSGRADPRSLTHRLASPNRLSASRLVGASPVRLPSSCSPAPRSDRAAQHLPCTAATMTAPSRTTQADRGQNSMEGAAQHSELPADRTLSRAVVIGGSIAGMFAAAACAPHFDEVIVLEKDAQIPQQPSDEVYTDGNEYARDGVARRGVPQYVQIHGMLAKGWDLAEGYMPGMQAAMEAAGAIRFNIITQGKESVNGITAYTPHAKGDLTNYLASRALIERVMREKLLDAHANIDVRWANPAAGLQHGVGDDKGCITGVKMQDGTVMAADLVVDASGPRGKTKQWLAEGGYPVQDIRTVEVDPHVGYTMEVLDVPDEVAKKIEWKFNYVRPQAPETKGFLAIQVERGRFQVGTIGYGKDNHPPMDHDGYVAFLESFGQPDITEIVRSGTPVLRRSYKSTKDVRHYYEDIALPGNFAVIGDAVAKFNPAYGQGITVAGVQVEALEAVLKERSGQAGDKVAYAQLRDLSSSLQKRISEKVDFAWTLACSEDLKHATTDGERTNSWAADVFAAYFQQLWFAATVDEKVKMVYQRVGNMLDDVTALLAPNILMRVALYRIWRSLGIIKAPVVGNGRAASAP